MGWGSFWAAGFWAGAGLGSVAEGSVAEGSVAEGAVARAGVGAQEDTHFLEAGALERAQGFQLADEGGRGLEPFGGDADVGAILLIALDLALRLEAILQRPAGQRDQGDPDDRDLEPGR